MPAKDWKLYKTVEWKEKSNEIQKRDDHKCLWCNRDYQKLEDGNFLIVHHKYYRYLETPWDAWDDALVTLCHLCHKAYHKLFSSPTLSDHDLFPLCNTFSVYLDDSKPSFLVEDPVDWVHHHLYFITTNDLWTGYGPFDHFVENYSKIVKKREAANEPF